jgi:hypothetical protein
MKKLIFKYFLISNILLLPAIAQGASIYNPALAIYPTTQITTQDAVYAQLSGDFATTGYVIEGEPLVTITANNIGINFSALPPDGIVLFVLTPFSINANIGQLNAGAYNVNANFYVNGVLEHTLTDSFTVSAVPLPAALWLFGSGLIALFSLRRKSVITA